MAFINYYNLHPFIQTPLTQTIDTQAIISDIRVEVLTTVNKICQDECQLLPSHITNPQLDCTINNVAVYRATIDVNNGENCTQFITILRDWVATGPSFIAQAVRIRIASYCEVEFASFDDRNDCVDPSDNNTTTTEATSPSSGPGVGLTMEEIITVSVVGGVVGLLLILTLLVICCVFIVRISRVGKLQ